MVAAAVTFRASGGAGITQDAADSATGWSAGSLDTDSEVQNTGCIGAKVSNATQNFDHTGTSRDFVGVGAANEGDHVYVWLNCTTPSLDTIANGGLRVRVGNDTSNIREFYVGGDGTLSDDPYRGGWRAFVVDPTLAADASRIFDTGTPDMNTADTFGGTVKTVSTIMGNFNNGLIDAIRIGIGLRITDGTGLDPDGDFADFLAADEGTKANRYGVIRSVAGVNLVQGKLIFGDGTTSTEFTDTNQVVVFEDANVDSIFYEMEINTDATVTFGAISGGVTSGGCFFDSEGTNKYAITVISGGTVEAIFNAYASTFNGYRTISLNASSTVQDCTFSNGDGTVDHGGATIDNCNFLNSAANSNNAALSVDDNTAWGGASPVVTNCFFSGNDGTNGGAIIITATGTYDFDNLTFAGNTHDVINNSGGAVTINVLNGGDTPSVRNVGLATTTINNSVTVKIQGVTEGTACKFVATETVGTITAGDTLGEGFADSTGTYSFSLNYESAFNPSGLDCVVRARNSGICVKAWALDGAVYTDETTAANSATADDMNLLPASPAFNDMYYFGATEPFLGLKLDITDANGTGSTISWQVFNSGSWSSPPFLSDGTNNFENTGENLVTWQTPSNWQTTSVNGVTLYWIRARLAVVGSANQTRARKVTLNTTRYLPFQQNNTITSAGLTVTASWVEDTVAKFTQ